MRNFAFAIAIAATVVFSGPARAMNLTEAAARLVAIDSELTRCINARLLGAMILVRTLRKCIADERPNERALRKDLNDWISTLAGDDPNRAEALNIRVNLNGFRRFMNQLDDILKSLPEEIESSEAVAAFDTACENAPYDPFPVEFLEEDVRAYLSRTMELELRFIAQGNLCVVR